MEVPKRYVTEEGYSLGSWLQIQRLFRAGKVSGILTDAQIKLLAAIGMSWEKKDPWMEKFQHTTTNMVIPKFQGIMSYKVFG